MSGLPSAVCERGHVLGVAVGSYTLDDVRPFCPDHGTPVVRECAWCGEPVASRAPAHRTGHEVAAEPEKCEAPNFCAVCTSPFPWASREARIDQIRGRLGDAPDDATRLRLNEQLDCLADPDISDAEATRILKRTAELWPGIWDAETIRPIIVTVVSTAVLKACGWK